MDKRIHIQFFTYQNNQSFLLGKSTITMNCQLYKNFPVNKIDHTICTKNTSKILHTQFITAKWYYLVQWTGYKVLQKQKWNISYAWSITQQMSDKREKQQQEETEVRNVSLHQQSQQQMMIHHMKMKTIVEQLL